MKKQKKKPESYFTNLLGILHVIKRSLHICKPTKKSTL